MINIHKSVKLDACCFWQAADEAPVALVFPFSHGPVLLWSYLRLVRFHLSDLLPSSYYRFTALPSQAAHPLSASPLASALETLAVGAIRGS